LIAETSFVLNFGLRDYDDMNLHQLARWHEEALAVFKAANGGGNG
jgi:hypothetical protein